MATHGTFHWNELMTRDLEGAKAFYGALFGWETSEMEMETGPYTLAHVAGEPGPVAGLMTLPEDMANTPPHWGAYVAVDDVEESVAQVDALGGKVVMPPMTVDGVGQMALIADPAGAHIFIMTPEEGGEAGSEE